MSRGNPLQLFDLTSVLSCATVTRTTPKHPPNDHVSRLQPQYLPTPHRYPPQHSRFLLRPMGPQHRPLFSKAVMGIVSSPYN